MRNRRTTRAVLAQLGVAVMVITQAAAACELEWVDTEVYSGFRSDCDLAKYFAEFDGQLIREVVRVDYSNLRAQKVDFDAYPGPTVEFSVEVKNTGTRSTPAVPVIGLADLFAAASGDPLGGTQPFQYTIPAMDPGDRFDVYVGTISLRSADQDRDGQVDFDVDVEVSVVVDPGSSSNPRGAILELDEDDNRVDATCRYYAPNAQSATVPPCT